MKWALSFVLWVTCLAAASDSTPAPLGFKAALDKILGRSPDISLSELNLQGARARNIPRRFAFFPTLSLSGNIPFTENFLTNPQALAVNSTWNLFRGGGDYFSLLSGVASEESERFAVESSVLVAEQAAVEALLVEILKFKELGIYQLVIQDQVRLLEIARERYRRGILPLQEVEKLTVDLENTRASLADSQVQENQARANLESLLGHADIMIEWPWITPLKSKQVTTLVDEELRFGQRPDWNSSQKDVEAQAKKLSREWSVLAPTVDAQLSWGDYRGYFGAFNGWVGMVSISFPLFDQLKNYSNIKEQTFLMATSEAKLEKVQREAKRQWQSSRQSFLIALDSVKAREKNLALSSTPTNKFFRMFRQQQPECNLDFFELCFS